VEALEKQVFINLQDSIVKKLGVDLPQPVECECRFVDLLWFHHLKKAYVVGSCLIPEEVFV